MTPPGVQDEPIDDRRSEAMSDQWLQPDEVVDSHPVLRASGHGQHALPLGIVAQQVPLDEADRLSVALDDEELGRVRAVDRRSVSGLDRRGIEVFEPPGTHVGCGQPL